MDKSVSITKAARTGFAPEQVKLMKDTVAKDCTDAEFHFFLEVCARYEFNPFLGEIYAARMPGKNGGQGRVAIIVGRNGWIKEANRHSNFKSLDSDVVREGDVFKVVRTPDGHRSIHHEFEMGPDKKRGAIVGSWAEVSFKDGRPPVFFFAPVEDYRPTNLTSYSPWSKQESVMMLKCAQVAALRLSFNIGGVYDEAEMANAFAATSEEAPVHHEINWGDDPEVASRLQRAVATANEVQPGSWLPERTRLKLDGCQNTADRLRLAEEVEAFIVAKGGTVPEVPEPEVVDAEVVTS